MAVIVTLQDAKSLLNIPASTLIYDDKLTTVIDAVTEVVEGIVGPVIARNYDEWYDGGTDTVVLRHRPVIAIATVTEWQGSVSYTLNDATPPGDVMDAFGYMPFLDRGVIQRTAYGVPSWFASLPWWAARTPAWYTGQPNRAGVGLGRVHVVYQAGYMTAPNSIQLGAFEIIRDYWESTQRGDGSGRPVPGRDDLAPDEQYQSFFVSARARELLLARQQSRQIA